jgi:hypothetical protein
MGRPAQGGAFILNSGDTGLLRALDVLSAADASQSVNGGASIAAHASHLRYGLSLMNRWAREGGDPFADATWDAAWKIAVVDDPMWQEIREGLRSEADRLAADPCHATRCHRGGADRDGGKRGAPCLPPGRHQDRFTSERAGHAKGRSARKASRHPLTIPGAIRTFAIVLFVAASTPSARKPRGRHLSHRRARSGEFADRRRAGDADVCVGPSGGGEYERSRRSGRRCRAARHLCRHRRIAGFTSLDLPNVAIRSGARTTREVELKIAAVLEEVNVTPPDADRQLLDAFTDHLTPDQIAGAA